MSARSVRLAPVSAAARPLTACGCRRFASRLASQFAWRSVSPVSLQLASEGSPSCARWSFVRHLHADVPCASSSAPRSSFSSCHVVAYSSFASPARTDRCQVSGARYQGCAGQDRIRDFAERDDENSRTLEIGASAAGTCTGRAAAPACHPGDATRRPVGASASGAAGKSRAQRARYQRASEPAKTAAGSRRARQRAEGPV